METPFEINRNRAKPVNFFLYISIGIGGIRVLLFLYSKIFLPKGALREVLQQPDFVFGAADYVFAILSLTILVDIPVLILTAIFFVRWMHSTYSSIQSHGGTLPYSRSQVGWAFFIPFVNLYRPYQVIDSYYEEYQQLIRLKTDSSHPRKNLVNLNIWWVCWILTGIFTSLGGSEALIYSETGNTLYLIGDSLTIICGMAIITIINQMQVWESELAQLKAIDEIQAGQTSEF